VGTGPLASYMSERVDAYATEQGWDAAKTAIAQATLAGLIDGAPHDYHFSRPLLSGLTAKPSWGSSRRNA
jgi:hypothetical protein